MTNAVGDGEGSQQQSRLCVAQREAGANHWQERCCYRSDDVMGEVRQYE